MIAIHFSFQFFAVCPHGHLHVGMMLFWKPSIRWHLLLQAQAGEARVYSRQQMENLVTRSVTRSNIVGVAWSAWRIVGRTQMAGCPPLTSNFFKSRMATLWPLWWQLWISNFLCSDCPLLNQLPYNASLHMQDHTAGRNADTPLGAANSSSHSSHSLP